MTRPWPLHWQKNINIRLLACLVDMDEKVADNDYRVLVDGDRVKYVTTAAFAFLADNPTGHDRTFEPILLGQLFPPFPPGDWNLAHVDRHPEDEMDGLARRLGVLGAQLESDSSDEDHMPVITLDGGPDEYSWSRTRQPS